MRATGSSLLSVSNIAAASAKRWPRLGDGMRFAGSLDVLRQVAQDPPDTLQVLLGYAGWGPGQLENELTEGAWLLAPVSREVVFDVDRTVMWEHVVRSLGIEPSTLVASRGIH